MRFSIFVLLALTLLLNSLVGDATAQGKPTEGKVAKQEDGKSSAAAESNPPRSDELAAIRKSSQDFVAAFNKGDAKAVAALWTEAGDYQDEAGRKFAGRAAIEQEYARFFAEHKGVKIQVLIDELRLLSPEAAIEDGRAMLDPPPAGTPAFSKYTAVHIKVGGRWLMSTVRDTRVETPSAYRQLQDLEWMVGDWIAEEHGAKTEVTCQWAANKSFLQRTYTVTQADDTTTSGIQLIGWNPQRGRFQSWNFTSDGGHAQGTWTARDRGWAVETSGVLPDGTPTASVNLLTRLDDRAYAWQSVERHVGSAALPDTEEIVLKRRSAGR